jgi:hypothetical protein
MNPHKQHAGIWQAFAAGMFAEACVNSAKFSDEQLDPDSVEMEFLLDCGDAMAACGVEIKDALKAFAAGKQMMQELRNEGLQKHGLTLAEDNPPNEYTGAERQLAGKPDRRLS